MYGVGNQLNTARGELVIVIQVTTGGATVHYVVTLGFVVVLLFIGFALGVRVVLRRCAGED